MTFAEDNSTDVLATLRDQYQILSQAPLPVVEGSRGDIFRVGGKDQASSRLIAITGDRAHCFRLDIANQLLSIDTQPIMRLIDWGIVDWQGGGRQRAALIFQPPSGVSLRQTIEKQRRRFGESEILTQFLSPLVSSLKALAEMGIVHGGVRPGNIYATPEGGFMLGECLSGPASYDQPVSLLTVERALASRIGRGTGNSADDVYALGATMLHLAFGQVPLAALRDEDIISLKIDRGSFGLMAGRQPLTNGLMELARGMLDDDPVQRWSLDTIDEWLAGRRLVSSSSLAIQRPGRPFVMQDVEYWDCRNIADAFTRAPVEGVRLVANDELIKWIRRTLRDIPLAQRIADAVNVPHMRGSAASQELRLIGRVAMALHPSGPIRYQGQSLMPDAIGTALFRAILAGENTQIFAEIIAAQFPRYWYSLQGLEPGERDQQAKNFEHARLVLDRTPIGYGLERCLYDLAPFAPLLEAEFAAEYITDSRQFLVALETHAGRAEKPATPIGRHSAAFLISRETQLGAKTYNRLVNAKTPPEQAIGYLEVLAFLQSLQKIPQLPNLAQWLETLLSPCIDRFHNRQTREVIRGGLRKAAASGSLTAMLTRIDTPALLSRDRESFMVARIQYEQIEREAAGLKTEISPASHLYREAGREAAAVAAGILSLIIIAGVVILHLGQL